MVKTGFVLFKRIIRSVRSNWGQFLAIIGIATLAVTLFLGLSSSASSFENRVNELYAECNAADIWMTQTSFDRDEILSFSDVTNIANKYNATVEQRLSLVSTLSGDSNNAIITPINKVPTINKAIITKGKDPLLDDNYLIVDEAFLTKRNLSIGSNVDVSFSISLLINGVKDATGVDLREYISSDHITIQFPITAAMKSAENIENGSFSSGNYFLSMSYLKSKVYDYAGISEDRLINLIKLINPSYTKQDLYDLLNSFLSQYVFKCSNPNDISELKKELNIVCDAKNISAAILEIDEMPSNITVQADIIQAKKLTYVFPMIFFLVAVLVISTTCSQIILKERTTIGTMKAIGLSKNQILLHYLGLMTTLVGIGIILGTIIGPLLIPSVMGIKYSLLYSLPEPKYTFPVLEFFGLSIAMILIVAICVLLIIRHELSLSPSQSMRPAISKSLKVKEDKAVFTNKLFSLKMATRNIRLDWVKSLMVVIGIAGCSGLSVCGFGINDTIDHGVEIDMHNFFDSDVIYSYASGVGSIKDEVYLKYQSYIGNKDNIDELASNFGTFTSNNTTNQMDASLMVLSGNHPFVDIEIPYNKAAISQKVAEALNLKVGDKFSVSSYTNGTTYTNIEVGAIYEAFFRHGALINIDDPIYSDYKDELTSSYASMWINFDSSYDESQKINMMNEIFNQYKDTYFTTMESKEATADRISSLMSSIGSMTNVIKMFAVLLAVVVVYNFIYLNFKQRIRQMATQKVLGFDNSRVARSFVLEIMLLVLVGAFIGLLIGFPLQVLVLSINKTPLVEFLYYCYWDTYVISFVITVLTALALNLILSLLIRRVKMVESLKAVE